MNFLFLCLLPLVAFANKYSEDVNIPSSFKDEDNPFRMSKMNLVWHKAKKRLSESDLSGIHTELGAQDRLELDLKRRKAEKKDEDGEFEAVVRRKFMSILKRYGLLGVVDNTLPSSLPLDGSADPDKLDKKLNKIWKKAQMAGFTEDELSKLRVELGHQQEKMDEYNVLRNDISQFAADNSALKFDDKDSTMNYKQKKAELKKKYKNMEESFQSLEGYIAESPGEVAFKESRVIDLWLLAKKANFTEMELKSFKEELHHFERKLQKREFLEKELEVQSAKKAVIDGNKQLDERHSNLQKKVHDYDRRIKKTHTELKTRVAEALKYRSDL